MKRRERIAPHHVLRRSLSAATLLVLASAFLCAACVSPRAPEHPQTETALDEGAGVPALDSLAVLVHREGNRARRAARLRALAWSTPEARLAQAHADDMAERGYFDHVNPRGEDAAARGARMGMTCQRLIGTTLLSGFGENLYVTGAFDAYRIVQHGLRSRVEYDWKAPETLAREAIRAWLDSPGHRANLLNGQYQRHGVGVARDDQHRLYIVDVFC